LTSLILNQSTYDKKWSRFDQTNLILQVRMPYGKFWTINALAATTGSAVQRKNTSSSKLTNFSVFVPKNFRHKFCKKARLGICILFMQIRIKNNQQVLYSALDSKAKLLLKLFSLSNDVINTNALVMNFRK